MKRIQAWFDAAFLNRKDGHYKSEVVQTPFKEVLVLASGYWQPHGRIMADKRLTEDGKNAARREARTPIVTELEKWRDKRVAALNADISAQRAALYPSVKVEQSKVDALASRLRGFTPDEIAVLFNSAPDDVRRTMEATSVAEGLIPFKSAKGLEWKPLLDPKAVQESIEGRAMKENPAGVAKLRELEEIRDMTQTAANVAINEIKES